MGSNLWLWHCAQPVGEPEPRRRNRVRPINNLLKASLVPIHAAFAIGQRVAQKPGGDAVVSRRVGQQIAGNLLES